MYNSKMDKELVELKRKFKEYYKEHLQHRYAELEPQRKIFLDNFKKRFMWCCVGFIGLCCFFVAIESFSFDFLFYYIAFVVWVCSKPILKFKKATKSLVMEKILSFWGDYKYYNYKELLSYDYIKKSALFQDFNKQKQDDAFKGKYHNVEINVSEVELINSRRFYDDDESFNPDDGDKKVFDGVLIALHLNKKCKGKTIVCEKNFGKWGDLSNKEKNCQVFLEDVVFNKKWDVYADDQIEARYVLTPGLMEKMLEVKKFFHGNRLDFSFFGDNLLIAVHTRKDMFETTSLFKSALDYRKVQEVICQMYSVFSVIDVLKIREK